MTAEVAIMNKTGIALAADSAVTLGGGKIYNSADKLFALSKYHPVGIMIYGSASFMGIAWETIIKCYRDDLKDKSFEKLKDYENDFINYLARFPHFTDENMKNYLESRCYIVNSEILDFFIDELYVKFIDTENIKLSQIDEVFNEALKSIKEKFENIDDEKHINLDCGFIDSNMELIKDNIKAVFEEYSLSDKQIEAIVSILKLHFQKCVWIDDYTGIVIAGYGDREIFPSLCEFYASGKLRNSLIYFGNRINQIGTNLTATIIPFSQTEMVHQFAYGIDPDFSEKIMDKINIILKSLKPIENDPEDEKKKAVFDLMAEYLDEIKNIAFKNPIIDIVHSMEKYELVSMAEAMVNLTALKRHVSDDDESVGGPIDVALITKSDGFIWIKKKTNFDPALNRELNQNYFRSGKYGSL